MAEGEFLEGIGNFLLHYVNQIIPAFINPNLQLIARVGILLLVAFIAGKLGKVLAVKFLGVVGIKKITKKTWAENILKVTGYKGSVVELIGDIVKWIIYILFLGVVLQIIGLPGMADIFTQIAVFMPRFIGAILIVVLGFIIADFFGKMFEEAGKRVLKEDIISTLSAGLIKYSISILTIIIALALIGIDTGALTVMFTVILVTMMGILLIGIKDTFPNYSAGLQVRNLIKVGDIIKVGKVSGKVEKIYPFHVVVLSNGYYVNVPHINLFKSGFEKKVK